MQILPGVSHTTGGWRIPIRALIGLRSGNVVQRGAYGGRIGDGVNCGYEAGSPTVAGDLRVRICEWLTNISGKFSEMFCWNFFSEKIIKIFLDRGRESEKF